MPISFLRYLPPFLRPPTTPNGRSSATRQLQDPTSTSLSYIRDLERLTGCAVASGTLPEIYVGPYRDYLNTLRKEGKVGMVLITCAEHEDDLVFKRESLADAELVRFLREKDILVWAGDARSREGYQGEHCSSSDLRYANALSRWYSSRYDLSLDILYFPTSRTRRIRSEIVHHLQFVRFTHYGYICRYHHSNTHNHHLTPHVCIPCANEA